MSEQPSFPIPLSAQAEEMTGRYIITFRDNSMAEGLALLNIQAGITSLPSSADFTGSAINMSQLDAAGGAIFPTLGLAVVSMDNESLSNMMTATAENSAILAIEPERTFYAIGDGLPPDYLRGYRDAVNHLYEKGTSPERTPDIAEAAGCFADDTQSTFGLKAIKAVTSPLTGKGIKVAVLDTGFDLQHPDFQGRSIVSQSFVPGETVQDGNSHGTHCIGTSCGFKDVNGRQYGVAHQATIYVGKVLSNAGSGSSSWILAGMEWAIANQCQVISMSLGNTNPTPSTAYETIGRRALQNGCLIVAAAGNHGPGTVGQPANSPSIMAVAAVDSCLLVPTFSSPSGSSSAANVNIAAPGVQVYSSVPMSRGRYAVFNGTSMATPHIAGIAALYAQSDPNARGARLWQLLTSRALRLQQPTKSVGSGLGQAPQ
jgi:subtilisin